MTAIQERQAATHKPDDDDDASAQSSFREMSHHVQPIVIGNGFPPPTGPKVGGTPPPNTGTPEPPPLGHPGLPPQYPHIPRVISASAALFPQAITQSNARLALARRHAGESFVSYAADALPMENDTAAVLSQFKASGIDTGNLATLEAASVARSKAFITKSRDHDTNSRVGGAARYQAAKRRLLRAAPGSEILLPVQTQAFSRPRSRHRKPHGGLDSGPAYVLNNEVSQFSIWAKGANWGWGPDDEASNYFYIFWNFVFTPSMTANYKFTGVMWFSGEYLVTADDRWWNSKNASATLRCDIEAGPLDGSTLPGLESDFGIDEVPLNGGDPTTVYHVDKDNIHATGSIQDVEMLIYQTSLCDGPIEAGTATLIECIAYGGVDAKGGGSYAGFDFSGAGHGIGCPFLRVDRVD